MQQMSTRLTGFAWLKRIAFGVFKRFFNQDTSLRCAGTAFFGFLSFFPAIATGVLVYGLLADRQTLTGTLTIVHYILPAPALSFVSAQLQVLIVQPASTLGIGLLISVPLALWSASRGVDALLFAMSSVRAGQQRRNFFEAALYAVGLALGGSVFVSVALVIVAGLPALVPFPSGEDWLLLALRWPVLLALTMAVMAILYRFGPDRHPRHWRFIWPGAVSASLLWILAGAVFSIYVENFSNMEASFGSVTAAVVLLLWMYNSAQIFALGAAMNAEIEYAATGRAALAPEADK